MTKVKGPDYPSLELVEDLIGLLYIPLRFRRHPIKVQLEVQEGLTFLKTFFYSYYKGVEYDTPSNFDQKVAVWKKFMDYVLTAEIKYKPKDMSHEEFLFEVRYRKYILAAIDKVMEDAKRLP